MQQPPYLKKGDQVTIISTARKISKEEIEPAERLLKSWGLIVKLSEFLFEEENQFAGSAEIRAKALQEAINDEECKAIICARGGYGTVQIIDQIDFSRLKEKPKWIVGYSDVTVLHNHLQEVIALESIHATMPINFPKDESSDAACESLKMALFGEEIAYSFLAEEGSNLKNGVFGGQVVGGNLSILYSLTGTISQVDTRGRILFFEDLDEYIYHIDRMMMNLKRAAMLDHCSAVLIGGMSDMNDNAIPYGETAEEIINRNTNAYGYPVIFGFPAGHIKENLALIFGRKASIHIDGNSIKLTFNGRA
jgi:muramoyltetrapeptide carboxypeptidase